MPSTFEQLVADLSRDFQRAQPKDALQYCSSWFQTRLEEQRSRMRSSLVASKYPGISPDLYQDIHSSGGGSPANFGFGSARASPRPSLSEPPILKNPFGSQTAMATYSPQSIDTRAPAAPFVMIKEDEALSPTAFSNPFGSAPTHPSALAQSPFGNFSLGGAPNGGPGAPGGDFLGPPPSSLGRRTSVSAESIIPNSNNATVFPVHPKNPQQTARIKSAIKNSLIFRDLGDRQLQTVLDAMEEVLVQENEVVIRQGDQGDYFYVVESGLVVCYIKEGIPEGAPITGMFASQSPFEVDLGPGDPAGTNLVPVSELRSAKYHPDFGKRVADCGPGTTFGELALMYGHPRAATVLAFEQSTLWRLDRMTFRTIILKAAHHRRTMYENFLSQVSLLSGLSGEERSKIADALVSFTIDDGQVVIKEGDIGDTFFFVEEGQAVVSKLKKGVPGQEEELSTLKKGDYFGELSLLRAEPRAATIRAKTRTDASQPKLKVAQMSAAAFTRLLGPMREILERKAEGAYGIKIAQ